MDTLGKNEEGNIGVYECQEISFNQYFSFSLNEEIRHEDSCFVAEDLIDSYLKIVACDGSENQKWSHEKVMLVK